MTFKGAIIKETLVDELFLDLLTIEKVEIWKTQNSIKYWTMIWFSSDVADLPEQLSKKLILDYFADMKAENRKYIVFKGTVLSYAIGNSREKTTVMEECRKRGIPDHQMAWDE